MFSKFSISTGESLTWPDRQTGYMCSSAIIKFSRQSFLFVYHGTLSIVSFEHQVPFNENKPCGQKQLSDQTDFLSGQQCPWTDK